MLCTTGKQLFRFSFLTIVLSGIALFAPYVEAGVGESAVITLVFPPGARSTGTGEAFTGLADDASATYYNPAGLGLAPLANSWKVHLVDQKHVFTTLASKKKRDFGARSQIWAGTSKGLLRYNGKIWERHDFYLIEENDNLEKIARKFIDGENEKLLQNAAWLIRVENGIGMKRFTAIKTKIRHALKPTDSLTADTTAYSISRQIVELSVSERSTSKIFGIIGSAVDSTRANTLADEIDASFKQDDKDFDEFTELKIPFSIAITDSITATTIDNSDKLWIGTSRGLWRYYENRWTRFSTLEGLPSNNITALAAGPFGSVAIGTDNGIVHYIDGEWRLLTDSTKQLPTRVITSLAFGEQSHMIYAGTNLGLLKFDDKKVTILDTTDGLLSKEILALFTDSQHRLWIGGPKGITIFNNATWKRFQFPNSIVSSFAELTDKCIWIGTDKGAISYTAGKTVTDERGNVTEAPPEWKVFHSKNSLVGECVNALIVYDKDVWLATDRAINQYDNADRQASVAFEMLLPAFKLTDLWHLYFSLIWPTQDWGTLGFAINYINMGTNPITDELGREQSMVRSWEGVFGLSYGLTAREDLALGLNAKFVVSALAPGMGESGQGVGKTFAVDAAVLKRNFFLENFDLGFMAQNMGPTIYYVTAEQRDPIPFTLRLGLVYRAVETPVNDLKFLLDFQKEVVRNRYDGDPDPFFKAIYTDLINDTGETLEYELQEVNYNLGLEYWYANFVALRTGFLFDYLGERYEWTFGIGVRYSTLNFDWSYIHAPEGFLKRVVSSFDAGKPGATGARNGQWRAAFTFLF